jgi:hypothetical protein
VAACNAKGAADPTSIRSSYRCGSSDSRALHQSCDTSSFRSSPKTAKAKDLTYPEIIGSLLIAQNADFAGPGALLLGKDRSKTIAGTLFELRRYRGRG